LTLNKKLKEVLVISAKKFMYGKKMAIVLESINGLKLFTEMVENTNPEL
jgi:hypothetical protein